MIDLKKTKSFSIDRKTSNFPSFVDKTINNFHLFYLQLAPAQKPTKAGFQIMKLDLVSHNVFHHDIQ